MSSKDQSTSQRPGIDPVFHYAIQLLALALLLVWCFYIIQPFISILVWAAVLSTTLFPLHETLKRKLNNRNALSATIITIFLLVAIIGPGVWILTATAGGIQGTGGRISCRRIACPSTARKSSILAHRGQ
jgi:predicted PurR-regulated permease PerM